MASVLFVLLSMASSAAAQTRVEGSVYFPDYGEVASDRVCLTEDGQTLRTVLPAHRGYVCDESIIDYSDSTHPKTVCLEGHWANFPDLLLSAPVWSTARQCVKSSVDYSDSTCPKTMCHEWADVRVAQELTYRVLRFSPSDYRQVSPISSEVRTIRFCE